eukprot:scpid33752/ scgid22248/ Sec1 family domain-containing protein 2; Neuronal Sec1; Syntaxin-binding protein 1-like 1
MQFGSAGACNSAAELSAVVKDLDGTVLLVDSITSQLLHWWIGEGVWLCDAVRVLDIDDKDVARKLQVVGAARKVVFVTGRLLYGQRLQLIQRLLSRICSVAPACTQCSVYCTLPSSAHAGTTLDSDEDGSGGAGDPFDTIANQLRLTMQRTSRRERVEARVLHLPVMLAPVSPEVFFTPAHGHLQSLLPTDVARINAFLSSQHDHRQASTLPGLEMNMLPGSAQRHLKCVAHGFSELFRTLNVQEHCFSLGPTSRLVAAELASMPDARGRHKVATSSASVLFVDRSLDLSSALSCNAESLADTVRASLAPLPGHDVDVAVDMSSLLNVHSSCRHCVASGCLAHPANPTAQSLVSSFVGRKSKDALTELSRRLVDAIAQEKLPMDARRMSAISPGLLQSLIGKFRLQPRSIARHSALLQVAMAAALALESETTAQLQRCLSVEKVVLLTLAEEGVGAALDQLLTHMQSALDGRESLGVEYYLRLVIILYSAAGSAVQSITSGSKASLQECLEKLILHAVETSDASIVKLVGEKQNSDSIRLFVRSFFTQLQGIAEARSHLKMFRNVSGATTGSLLKQLAEALAAPDKPELPDVEYHSQYMRNLLKTGFSLFMGGSKPRPSDHQLLIIYVVGGLTCTEAKAVRERFSSARSDIQVVVGGTQLVTASSLLHQLCCSDSLHDAHI